METSKDALDARVKQALCGDFSDMGEGGLKLPPAGNPQSAPGGDYQKAYPTPEDFRREYEGDPLPQDCRTCARAARYSGVSCPPQFLNECQPTGKPWPYVNWIPRPPGNPPESSPPGSGFQAPGSAVSSPPATGDGLPATTWVLRELGRLRPMLETMLAMELAAGNITAAQIQHFVHDRDITRAICGRARRILEANRPRQNPPARPRLGLLDRLVAALGMTSEAEADWRNRRANWADATLLWHKRMDGCQLPHQPDPPAMKALKAADTLDAQSAKRQAAPDVHRDRPPSTASDPLVKTGPGGDYIHEIHAEDLDAAAPGDCRVDLQA